MQSLDERITGEFLRWSSRGQGIALWDTPVSPEPAFVPYRRLAEASAIPLDDGRKPTILSAFVRNLGERLSRPLPDVVPEPIDEARPRELIRETLVELQILSAPDEQFRPADYECLFSIVASSEEPIAFELIGDGESVVVQFVGTAADMRRLRSQLEAFFPDSVFVEGAGTLMRRWQQATGEYFAAVEFGLEREFQIPIRQAKSDPFMGLMALLDELNTGELGIFQVLIEPVRHPWAEHAVRSVSNGEGQSLFTNAPELFAGVRLKVSTPLYAAVVRVAFRADEMKPVDTMVALSESILRAFQAEGGNRLILLGNDEYPLQAHAEDVLARQSRRSGVILNAHELAALVHLPSSSIQSSKLIRHDSPTRQAPALAIGKEGVLLGHNAHAGALSLVRLVAEQRLRHTHIIGASGTGKSTLLFNLVQHDIENGEGIAVLDPHGDLVDRILGIIPPERIKDVVLIDPSDTEYPVGFNILHAHSELEKTLLASDLVSVFQRLSTSWGDQMGSVLSHAVLAFLESNRGGSLLDLRRFLLEPSFRSAFLETVRDPEIVYYWRHGFSQLTGNKSIGPILTRLETFLTPKSIRYMVAQRENRLDFADIMDTGKIFLAKLSQGAIGRENSYLLGTLFVSKFQQLAMARQSQVESKRRDFFMYVDEFANFITPSMAEILAGARKYRLGLILAHQELRQVEKDREVSSAVMANAYSRICFRVGDSDARTLESGFSHFADKDLQNLGTGEAICRVERSDFDFNIKVSLPSEPDFLEAAKCRLAVIAASREAYGRPRAEVEAALSPVQAAHERTPTPEAKAVPLPKAQPQPPAPITVPAPEMHKVIPEVAPKEPTPGRGGMQHKYLQTFIKEWAEGMGWRTTIEAPVSGGSGSVDVLLSKGGVSVACEISVTTSIGHEIHNLEKCARAGFTHVVSVCADQKRVHEIETEAQRSMGKDLLANVRFLTPPQLFLFVGELDARGAATDTTVKGYRVKVSYRPVERAERAERMASVTGIIAKSLKRMEGKDGSKFAP